MKYAKNLNSFKSTITPKTVKQYLEHCQSTLPEDNALILVDFAENYSFIIQGVFQGCYWDNSQAALHSFVIQEKNQENLTHESVCVT